MSDQFGHNESIDANFQGIFSRMDISPETRILDIAAGQCLEALKFASVSNRTFAVDTQRMPQRLLDIKAKQATHWFEYVCGDMHLLPFKSNHFDYVFIANAVHHSYEIETLLKNAYRVLKKGGKIVIIGEPTAGLFSRPERFNEPNETLYPYLSYIRSVKAAGFRNVRYYFPPAINMKLSTGKYGWKNVNVRLFRILYYFWKIARYVRHLLIFPAALIYNFQFHCIGKKV
ncbi:class I SAM-dependent methyltransferase [candidate division KSB1 bacterium]